MATDAGLGAVQLHGHETAEDCRWIRQHTACTIRAFSAGDPTIARFEEFGADYILIDGTSPGSGEVFDWRLAEGVVDHGPHDRLRGAARRATWPRPSPSLQPWGVDVSSGVESEPGRKDPQKVREFMPCGPGARRIFGSAAARTTRPPASASEPYDWMGG